MFKVGDKVRRISGINAGTPVGFEGVIREVDRDEGGDISYRFDGGAWGYADWSGAKWELAAPIGPVVTETVTKTRIVPGLYAGVYVDGTEFSKFSVSFLIGTPSADQLDAVAAVLSELAKGLRDA